MNDDICNGGTCSDKIAIIVDWWLYEVFWNRQIFNSFSVVVGKTLLYTTEKAHFRYQLDENIFFRELHFER